MACHELDSAFESVTSARQARAEAETDAFLKQIEQQEQQDRKARLKRKRALGASRCAMRGSGA